MEGLGSMGDKAKRIEKLSAYIERIRVFWTSGFVPNTVNTHNAINFIGNCNT
jgi:hypothetical protein